MPTAPKKKPPAAAAASLQLQQFLPYRINVLAEALSQALASQYQAKFQVTIPEWRVLATLGQEQPLSANQIGARTKMDKVKVSRAIALLAAKDLLDRDADEHDGRSWQLQLSAAGQRQYRQISALAVAWEQQLLEGFSATELKSFRRVIDALDAKLPGKAKAGKS